MGNTASEDPSHIPGLASKYDSRSYIPWFTCLHCIQRVLKHQVGFFKLPLGPYIMKTLTADAPCQVGMKLTMTLS